MFSKLLDLAKEHTDRTTPKGAERRYKCRIELLRKEFGVTLADSITPQMISRWLSHAIQKYDWRPATANRYKAFLYQMLIGGGDRPKRVDERLT